MLPHNHGSTDIAEPYFACRGGDLYRSGACVQRTTEWHPFFTDIFLNGQNIL